MDDIEAIAICENWFDHLDRQKEKAVKMQKLASLARQGPKEQKEAQRQMRQLDRQPKVYDGGNLRRAVKHLIEIIERLTADNERLRRLAVRVYNSGYHEGHNDTVEGCYTDILPVDMDSYHEEIVAEILSVAADND